VVGAPTQESADLGGRGSLGGAQLSASSISFAWNGRPILEELELELRPGEVVALRGANGVGKTTLVRVLTGSLEPDAGSVRIGTIDLASHRRSYLRRVGHLAPGDRGLYARLDVRANIALAVALNLAAGSRAHRADLVAAAIERFELGSLSRRRVDRLSSGQRQRVRLAVCLAHVPHVALFDEPSTSLDDDGISLLARVLTDHARRGGTALWVAPTGEPPRLPADRRLTLADRRVLAG
jgi:ABC-type multidrug transport system ATPase subunit